MLPNFCNVSSQGNIQIKLTCCIETNSQTVRALPSCVDKKLSGSAQLSMKFDLPIKMNILASGLSYVVFIMLINVKMPTIVGILTFMNMINVIISSVEHNKCFITSRSGHTKTAYHSQPNAEDGIQGHRNLP